VGTNAFARRADAHGGSALRGLSEPIIRPRRRGDAHGHHGHGSRRGGGGGASSSSGFLNNSAHGGFQAKGSNASRGGASFGAEELFFGDELHKHQHGHRHEAQVSSASRPHGAASYGASFNGDYGLPSSLPSGASAADYGGELGGEVREAASSDGSLPAPPPLLSVPPRIGASAHNDRYSAEDRRPRPRGPQDENPTWRGGGLEQTAHALGLENRSLRGLAERLRLELDAAEERTRQYKAICAEHSKQQQIAAQVAQQLAAQQAAAQQAAMQQQEQAQLAAQQLAMQQAQAAHHSSMHMRGRDVEIDQRDDLLTVRSTDVECDNLPQRPELRLNRPSSVPRLDLFRAQEVIRQEQEQEAEEMAAEAAAQAEAAAMQEGQLPADYDEEVMASNGYAFDGAGSLVYIGADPADPAVHHVGPYDDRHDGSLPPSEGSSVRDSCTAMEPRGVPPPLPPLPTTWGEGGPGSPMSEPDPS